MNADCFENCLTQQTTAKKKYRDRGMMWSHGPGSSCVSALCTSLTRVHVRRQRSLDDSRDVEQSMF
ncbi:uncharacterized protein MYCGRDRAFT_86449 [Zymoseptoria tritici IPO323]|uniref:Uncharacterized protein n=1 Tax=Zymoseptoria tritici (strain CBS 115943 / IPO323) TaxID=336722 RepID=F9XD35_ZYMTI|nr:uncharacterized protein MYCGRDRAFT_86449 [Zymoseptoria tritici IPO323]EGP86860.1 hypothetical protein MYCGRDRAFT_86449 [Zymoseptoria tritici IPO323]